MKWSSRFFLSLVAMVALLSAAVIVFTGTTETTYAASLLPTPTATDFKINSGSSPWGTAFDHSGNVWVAVPQCDPSPTCASNTPPGKLDVYNPTTKSWTASHQLPGGYSQAFFLAIDQQGRVWFPMPMTNSLGMYNPATNSYSQWKVPTAGSGPWDVAVDGHGTIWFTEHYSHKVGSFNTITHQFHEISTPAWNSEPYGIAVDKSNNVWFTENIDTVALIGEVTNTGALKEYKIRNGSTTGLTPHLITVDQTGNIWWTEGWVGAIGRLAVAHAVPGTNKGVTEYSYAHLCSNCGIHTSGITADGHGRIWFDDSLQNTYGYISISGQGTPTMFNAPTSTAHIHDGLHAAPNGVVWFTEEFANKLGKIS